MKMKKNKVFKIYYNKKLTFVLYNAINKSNHIKSVKHIT